MQEMRMRQVYKKYGGVLREKTYKIRDVENGEIHQFKNYNAYKHF